MMAQLLHDGPYLHGLGWLNSDYSCVISPMSTMSERVDGPVSFDGSGGYELRPGGSLADDLPVAIGRASGVARSRSASKSAVYAALLGKGLLQALPESCITGERIGVAISSSSNTMGISQEFETVGVRQGWSKTDTLLLPSSIPSAITTQTSAVFGTHAAAIAFMDGAIGVCAAFEYAYLSFIHDRSDAFLIMGADETCTVQTQALDALGDQRPRTTGAAGICLARTSAATSGSWQLVICEQTNSAGYVLPEGWSDAARLTINMSSDSTLFTASLIPLALHQLLRGAQKRALLFFNMPNRPGYSGFVLGFQQTAGK